MRRADLPLGRERVRESLEMGRLDITGDEELEISSSPRWGKNEQCFCGSGESFSRCHGTAIYREAGGE